MWRGGWLMRLYCQSQSRSLFIRDLICGNAELEFTRHISYFTAEISPNPEFNQRRKKFNHYFPISCGHIRWLDEGQREKSGKIG